MLLINKVVHCLVLVLADYWAVKSALEVEDFLRLGLVFYLVQQQAMQLARILIDRELP
jgi:hypothetical protein